MTVEPAAASFEEKRAEQKQQTFPSPKTNEEHKEAEKQVEDVKPDEKAAVRFCLSVCHFCRSSLLICAQAAIPASTDTGSGSDSEAHARVLPHTVTDNAHMLKIKKVREVRYLCLRTNYLTGLQEFDTLRHDALDLAAEAEKIHPEQFRDDVEGGIRKLDLMQRRCMVRRFVLCLFFC